jgi:hypothetical protein
MFAPLPKNKPKKKGEPMMKKKPGVPKGNRRDGKISHGCGPDPIVTKPIEIQCDLVRGPEIGPQAFECPCGFKLSLSQDTTEQMN